MDGRTVLLPAPPDTDIEICSSCSEDINTLPSVDLFRSRFFDNTSFDVYTLVSSTGSEQQVSYQICCAKRNLGDGRLLEALFFSERGIDSRYLVVGENETIENVLPEALSPSSSSSQWLKVQSKRHVKEQTLLALEARIGRRRGLSVGVIFSAKGQWKEEDMVSIPLNQQHEDFLRLLGEEITAKNTGFCQFGTDFVASCKKRAMYCTNFYGFEVLFHVSSMLDADERRQHIGNDKVVIFCCCDEDNDVPMVPRFRGDVNSVGIVCQKRSSGWLVAAYRRQRVRGFQLMFSPNIVISDSQLRRAILGTAIFGHFAVLSSPPYDAMMARAFQEHLMNSISDLHAAQTKPEKVKSDEGESSTVTAAVVVTEHQRRLSFSLRKRSSSPAFPGVRMLSETDSIERVRRRSYVDDVPIFLQDCVHFLSNRLSHEGLFRMCGSSSAVKRILGNCGCPIDEDEDVDAVASSFKAYMTQFMTPVIPSSVSEIFLIRDTSVGIEDARWLVSQLDAKQQRLLKYLCQFFGKVVSNASINKMTLENLAIVFGPVLMPPPVGASPSQLLSNCPKQLCALLIAHHNELLV